MKNIESAPKHTHTHIEKVPHFCLHTKSALKAGQIVAKEAESERMIESVRERGEEKAMIVAFWFPPTFRVAFSHHLHFIKLPKWWAGGHGCGVACHICKTNYQQWQRLMPKIKSPSSTALLLVFVQRICKICKKILLLANFSAHKY